MTASDTRSAIRSVLLIDDEPDIRIAVEMTISSLTDWTVHTAVDGSDGIDQAHRHLPDVILLDVMMPNFDGYQVRAELRSSSQTQHIPIIMLTAHAEECTSNARSIQKPFDPMTLPEQICALVEIHAVETSTSPDSAHNLPEALRSSWRAALPELLASLDSCDELITRWSEEERPEAVAEQARCALHNVVGGAGTFGFPTITDIARTAHDLMRDTPPAVLDGDTYKDLSELLRRLRHELVQSSSSSTASATP